MAASPLHNVRVLDMSRVLAGPFCTMQLADLGADVIKIEHPRTGDDSRAWKPPAAGSEGYYYLALNRTKQSVALDITKPEGKTIVRRLAAASDVLIENFRPGVMQRLGLDYGSLGADNPRLVYCSISAYGQTGPMADRPGFDPVLQAEFGLMAMTGEPDGAPLRHPLPIVDTFTAMYATSAILAAIVARSETGRGQYIDLALMNVAAAILGNASQFSLMAGQDPPRSGNFHPTAVPAGCFETRTGSIYMSLSNDRLFETFCRDILERPDLLADPRYGTGQGRAKNAAAVYRMIAEAFAAFDRDALLGRLRRAGLPAGAVRGVVEALASPEIKAAGMIVTVDHPHDGNLPLVGTPFRLSDTPVAPATAPPLLGAQTESVLRNILGLDEEYLAGLRSEGVIR